MMGAIYMEHGRLGVDQDVMGEEMENAVQIGHPKEGVNSVKEGIYARHKVAKGRS